MRSCVMKDPVCSYVPVSKDNLPEVIEFLGRDFIAITSGAPITVGKSNIQYNESCTIDNIAMNLEHGMVVFCKWATPSVIQVAPMNSYIVFTRVSGYTVMTEEMFNTYYRSINKTESEEGAENGES